MKRREFLWALSGAGVVWPIAQAQSQERTRRVAVLLAQAEDDPESQVRVAIIRQTLQERGWTIGRNVQVELRWFNNEPELAKRLARELADLSPDAILVQSTPGIEAVRSITQTIPTVFVVASDPVGSGIVASVARPGGNITGFSSFEPEIGTKWLEALKEVASDIHEVAVLLDPELSAFASIWRSISAVAPTMGLQLLQAPIRTAADIEPAIVTAASKSNRALLVVPNPLTTGHRDSIIRLAALHRLPAIYPFRFFAVGGGLMSYGIDQNDLFRRGTGYIDRILKGEKPADLPVQAPSKYEFVMNLKTAKALGLSVPTSLLLRANEVIE